MSDIVTVTADNFSDEVLHAALPTLVDLSAAWCAPCRMLAPEVEKLASQTEGLLKVAKLDVQQDAAIAAQYGVSSIPTMLLFANGELVERLGGYMPAARILEKIRAHLA